MLRPELQPSNWESLWWSGAAQEFLYKRVALSWSKRRENISHHPVKCMQEERAGNSDCNPHPESPYYISKDVILLYTLNYHPFSDDHPLTVDANQVSHCLWCSYTSFHRVLRNSYRFYPVTDVCCHGEEHDMSCAVISHGTPGLWPCFVGSWSRLCHGAWEDLIQCRYSQWPWPSLLILLTILTLEAISCFLWRGLNFCKIYEGLYLRWCQKYDLSHKEVLWELRRAM